MANWTIRSKTEKTSLASTDGVPIQEAGGTTKWFSLSSLLSYVLLSSPSIPKSIGDVDGAAQPPVNGFYRVINSPAGMLYPAPYGIGRSFASSTAGRYVEHHYQVANRVWVQITTDSNPIALSKWIPLMTGVGDISATTLPPLNSGYRVLDATISGSLYPASYGVGFSISSATGASGEYTMHRYQSGKQTWIQSTADSASITLAGWTRLTDGNGNPVFPVVATTASAANAYIAGSGNTILQSTSSAKYKTDIRDLEDTSTLDALRPVLYKSNPETVPGDDPTLDHYGFIAEELHEIDEKLVQYKEDESGEKTPNGVQYDRVVVLLVKRIHELEARLTKAGI